MEKFISQEERIRRAEEIYNRRNKSNNCHYKEERKNLKDKSNNKKKIKNKMIIQIIICTIMYFIIYTLESSNEIFSKDVMDKTKEILSYDISIQNLYNEHNKNTDNIKEKNNKEITTEELKEEKTEEEKIKSLNVENEKEENKAAKVEESAEDGKKEKTQEELDIEYIKENSNIIWPLKGTITSRFGKRIPTKIVSAFHKGIDIAGNTGDTIECAWEGTVSAASEEAGYGKYIKIENGEITTLYAHCSKLLVKEGEYIKQGQKIAEVGATGKATGPHLHFEIRRENRYIDPEKILGDM